MCFYKFFLESSLREKETSSNVENNLCEKCLTKF